MHRQNRQRTGKCTGKSVRKYLICLTRTGRTGNLILLDIERSIYTSIYNTKKYYRVLFLNRVCPVFACSPVHVIKSDTYNVFQIYYLFLKCVYLIISNTYQKKCLCMTKNKHKTHKRYAKDMPKKTCKRYAKKQT